MKKLYIVGARPDGSSKVVLDIALLNGSIDVAGFFDDDRSLWGHQIEGYPVIGKIDLLYSQDFRHSCFALAFANGFQKEKIFNTLVELGLEPINLLHPSAIIARSARLGRSIWMPAGVVVNPGATIGDGVVLNTGCTGRS